MITKPKGMYQGQPGILETTLYTVPEGNTMVLKEIIITNTSALAATISLSVVPAGNVAGVTNRIKVAEEIAANKSETFEVEIPMKVGDFISGLQGTADSITLTISGEEILTY